MKHIKTYEVVKNGLSNGIYDTLFTDVGTNYRSTSFKRLKSIQNFEFFKEFLDEILLNKRVIFGETFKNSDRVITVKNYKIGLNSITINGDNVNEMIKFRISRSVEIGPMEKLALEYLEIIKIGNKFNL